MLESGTQQPRCVHSSCPQILRILGREMTNSSPELMFAGEKKKGIFFLYKAQSKFTLK
jgi:hypothetical protein